MIVERAISLTQPWATLMAIGAKKIETRDWKLFHRGWLAIHASKAFPLDCQHLCLGNPFFSWLRYAGFEDASALPRGAVIAVANFTGYKRTEELLASLSDDEEAFGNYGPDRYGFLTDQVRRLREPIPMKGALKIWKMPRPITDEDLLP